jgi:hypothetical protein
MMEDNFNSENLDNEVIAETEPIGEVQDVVDADSVDNADQESVEDSQQIQQSKDDNAKYAAARRQSEREMKSLKDKQDSFAKQFGYNTFEELEIAQQHQNYINQGYDPNLAKKLSEVDTIMKDLKNQQAKTKITEEKQKLYNKKYFKELEADVDEILNLNPSLSVEYVFNFVRGQKMDELMAKETKVATQRQLNNMSGKSHIKPDGKGIDTSTVKIDEDEFRFYKGLNPKATREEYAQFLKNTK